MSDLAPVFGVGGAGAAVLLFILWLKRRIESGHVTIRIGSRAGEQLEAELEQARLQIAARDARIEHLERAVDQARSLEEHWQRQHIEYLQRRT